MDIETAAGAVEAAFALLPLIALIAAARRTGHLRMYVAAAGFAAFCIRGMLIFVYGRDAEIGEWIELAGGLIGLGLFAAAFVLPMPRDTP